MATAAAAPAPTPAQADPAAAPSQRAQRACVVMRAVLAAAPLVAAAPAAAPKPAKPRALAPKPAGIAKKVTVPKPPVSGLFGGNATFSVAEMKELLRALPNFVRDKSGSNTHGYNWKLFNQCVVDNDDDFPLWKARIRGKESRVATRLYGRMVASGELKRLLAEIARGV